MKSELVPTNQAKLTLPPLSSYIKKKGDDLISHPHYFIIFLLVVSRMNHEVALRVLAHWAKLRSLLADNYVTAV